jgi:hypothetical protein
MSKKKPKIVKVDWLDAASALSGGSEKELEHVSDNMTSSVGFFVKKERKGIYFSTDWCDGEPAGAIHFVPNGMLQSLTNLGEVAAPAKKPRKEKASVVLSVEPSDKVTEAD